MAPNAESNVEVEAHPMNGGDGINSYSQNSSYQRGVIDAARKVILEAVAKNLELTNLPKCFKIADLGCSTGPNTFLAVENIVEAIENKFHKDSTEVQVFFNDHVGNDFNILFRSLPPNRRYFAAGVPGSFYTRLFPEASLHLVHCSYALHWLSKVPKEITEKSSLAWNKGSIHYTGGADKNVRDAYFRQFQKDMDIFLQARAQELVVGGLMLLQLPGLPAGEVLFTRTGAGLLHALLGETLMDMAHMGVISEEKVDSFNLPQYHPSPEELELVIDTNNSFSMEKIGTLDHPFRNIQFDVQRTCTQVRSIMEGILAQHFGDEFMDDLFHRYYDKLAKNYVVFDKEIRRDADFFLVLKRKNN